MREIVLDTETTGLDPLRGDRLVEVGCVELFNRMPTGQSFHRYMNPERDMSAEAFAVHGLSTEFLADKPRFGDVVEELLSYVRDAEVIIHNAPFDVGFLRAACAECGLAWPGFTVLDTVMLARQLMDPDEVPDCKLGTLAGFFRVRSTPSHRALADARATADVLGWLIRRLTHRGIRTVDELRAWPDVVA